MPGESIASWTQTPVTTGAEVRRLTGYLTERDIPNADLDEAILRAQAMTMSAIASRVTVPLYGPIDGSNTRFAIPYRLQNRVILDSDASGNETTDLAVVLETPGTGGVPPSTVAAVVSTVDALRGVLVLSAAPASTVRRVLFSGWLLGQPISRQEFKAAVELLSAHLVDQRVRGPGAVVLSNPQAGNKEGTAPQRTWFAQWEAVVDNLRGATRPRAASVRTGLPFQRLGRVECGDHLPEWGCP